LPAAAGAPGADGPLVPVTEREPDNDPSRAVRLQFGEPESGRLSNPDDRDLFRFSLAAPEHIRLTVAPPPDGQVQVALGRAIVRAAREPGQPVVLETVLGPGEVLVDLAPLVTSDLPYTVGLERLDPFELPADLEPFNNDRATAPAFPPQLALHGQVNLAEDWVDWWRLPAPAAAGELTLQITGGPTAQLRSGDATLYPQHQDPSGAATYVVAAGQELQAGVWGSGAYTLTAAYSGGPAPAPPPVAPPLRMSLSGAAAAGAATPAAFAPYGQRMAMTATLTNTGSIALPVALRVAAGDLTWAATLEQEQVTLAPGQVREVPVNVALPAGVPAGRPVRLTVRAGRPGETTGVSAFAEVAPECGAPAADPDPAWSTAGPLAGGLDAAWSGLGGRVVGDPGSDAAGLNDGLVSPARGFVAPAGSAVTVDLAGDAPWPVAGFLLNPQGRQAPEETLRAFEVALSDDGAAFTTVLQGALSGAPAEQVFPLPVPVPARYARLTLLAAAGATDRVGLGEWKVVAEPGAVPQGAAPLDLLDLAAGGHIVWAAPLPLEMQALLTARDDLPGVRTEPNGGASWVAGFRDDRAAQVTALQWRNGAGSDPDRRIPAVKVSYSLGSPLGPWLPLADWTPDARSVATQTLTLPAPTWVRFLRFDAPAAPEARYLALPDQLGALERRVGDGGYLPAPGEWGQDARAAFYERSRPAAAGGEAAGTPVSELEPNDGPDAAQELAPGITAAGTVQVARDQDWYRVQIPEGMRRLELALEEGAADRVEVMVSDAAGNPVPASLQVSGDRATLTATVAPGAYLLRVAQRRRSVVFAWDTSGSVTPFVPVIYPALAVFAAGIDPATEAVNLLPFSERPLLLLKDFSGDPETVMRALQDYSRMDNSSNAEAALATAAGALAARPGDRAVILITDAVSSGYQETERLWQELARARPRVEALEVSSNGLAQAQDLMQDWAAAAGGRYTPVMGLAELETGFERATCALRGPAAYRISVSFAADPPPPPKPGSIAVRAGAHGGTAPAAGAAAGAAVEVILDASGSMLQRIGRQTRMEIARGVLNQIVSGVLPTGTPFALRAFGHRQAGSCRTDLEIPLGPLDPAAAKKTIAAIQAKNGAKTPIAASLRLAGQDLGAAQGRKVLVLVTDGEETCGGDPAAEIRKLREQGLDVQLNIVGFGVEDDRTRALFRDWAALGGGQFLSARDGAELSAAMALALQPLVRVLDGDGKVVGEGAVNGPGLAVPPGVYTVEVLTSPPRLFENVVVAPGEAVTLGE
jgi:hypothetical protein